MQNKKQQLTFFSKMQMKMIQMLINFKEVKWKIYEEEIDSIVINSN